MRSSDNRFIKTNYRAAIQSLENSVAMNKVNLEANKILGNQSKCMHLKHKIADAKIKLLFISGDLPS